MNAFYEHHKDSIRFGYRAIRGPSRLSTALDPEPRAQADPKPSLAGRETLAARGASSPPSSGEVRFASEVGLWTILG
jgi:hypothetical protein